MVTRSTSLTTYIIWRKSAFLIYLLTWEIKAQLNNTHGFNDLLYLIKQAPDFQFLNLIRFVWLTYYAELTFQFLENKSMDFCFNFHENWEKKFLHKS